ncbi:MAG: hypothetical protein L6290_11125 [Thermodesulfovibrionales bacterium]|nr:hypothetical protein [Thermodesulfovibrionales bacterium]
MAYKTLNDSFYYDAEIRQLPKVASDLLLYLITNPHSHFSGIYYLPLATVPIESKLTVTEIDSAISILSNIEEIQKDVDRVSSVESESIKRPDRVSVFETNCKNHFFIRFDKVQNIVFVKSMLRHQTGGRMSEKQIRSVLSQVQQFSKSSVIVPFLEYHRDFLLHCFLAFEKAQPPEDRKFDVAKARREKLKNDVEEFYHQFGLSFFCTKKYPIRELRQEEASAEEEASADNQLSKVDQTIDDRALNFSGNNLTPSKEEKERIAILCLQLKDLNHGFNPYQFVKKTINKNIPYTVTMEVLAKMVKYKATIKNAWAYAIDVLQKDYQQYNYAQAMKEHMQYKEPVQIGKLTVVD